MALYDITNEKHTFAIHTLFEYLSLNWFKPEWKDNSLELINEKVDPINLTKKLNGKMIWILN